MSPEEQKHISDHLRAAIGYLELGMSVDAWNELEAIDAEHRGLVHVLTVRLEVCRALEKWETMAEIARFLAENEPNESGHLLNLAYATRRFDKVESAESILSDAESKFPEDPLIKYNLGCYRAVLGRVGEAKLNLAEAFQRDPDLRITALDDPDLEGVW
jgi:predicted Zn-dependent protease